MSDFIRTGATSDRLDARLIQIQRQPLVTNLVEDRGGMVIPDTELVQITDLSELDDAGPTEYEEMHEEVDDETTLYRAPGYMTADGVFARPPIDIQPGITEEVGKILHELGIGSGICWIWSLAAAASSVLERDFSRLYEDFAAALGGYTIEGLLMVNPDLPAAYKLPIFQDGIEYLVDRDGGINLGLFDKKYRDSLLYLFNYALASHNIPVRIGYADITPALLQCTSEAEVERLMLMYFAEQTRQGRAVTFVMDTRTEDEMTLDEEEERLAGGGTDHMVTVTGVYKSKEGRRYLGICDPNCYGQVYIPSHLVGRYFFGHEYFAYGGNMFTRFFPAAPFLVVLSTEQRKPQRRSAAKHKRVPRG